jgi:hypothetical protein
MEIYAAPGGVSSCGANDSGPGGDLPAIRPLPLGIHLVRTTGDENTSSTVEAPDPLSVPVEKPMDDDEARSRLGAAIGSDPGAEHAINELLPLWKAETEVAQTPGKIGALLPFRYVIPDQDLKLVDTAFSVLTVSAAAGYFVPQLGFDPAKGVVAAITGVTVAVLRMLHNLKLAVHLERCDHAIVVALACARGEGLSVPVLLKGLQPSFPQLTPEELERRLDALTACATVGGTKSALVWKDGNGNWHANGV